MKQYVMNIEPALVKEMDKLIKELRLHSSRNEFIRDAIRAKVMEYKKIKIEKLLTEKGLTLDESEWAIKTRDHHERKSRGIN